MIAELSPLIIFYYAIGGVFAGLVGGLLGLGGGIIVVPLLHFLFNLQGFPGASLMQVAVTTSLATVIVTSLAATRIHHQKQAVLWPLVLRLAPGIVIGAGLGALLADAVSSDVLRIAFGVFEILVAIQIAVDFKPAAKFGLPATQGLVLSGGGIGFLSTLLGIGGGTLTVPYLLFCRVPMHNAVAVSSACGLPIAVAGMTAMIISGLDNPELPVHSIGYLYWPGALIIIAMTVFCAPVGARLAHRLPVLTLKRCFSVVLLLVGLKMLFPV
ncbi:MAG: sulfite exporter TauE/SafE family protein [Gammaproteobacteria bacterium]